MPDLNGLPENLNRTIGKLEATVNDFKQEVANIHSVLKEIKDELKEGSKLGVSNQFRIELLEKRIDNLESWKTEFIDLQKKALAQKKTWWSGIYGRIFTGAIMLIVGIVFTGVVENAKMSESPLQKAQISSLQTQLDQLTNKSK